MSEYSYHDGSRHRHRHRHRTREREPEYTSETTSMERGGRGAAVRDPVYRPARDESIEDIPRKSSPPGTGSRQKECRENVRPRRGDRDYNDDYYDRRDRSRPSRDYDHHSGDYERRPKLQRRESVANKLKEHAKAVGLGGVMGAVTGQRNSRSPSRGLRKERHARGSDSEYNSKDIDDRRRHRYSSSERSRSRGGKPMKIEKWQQAAKAGVVAGAVEAFHSRKTSGPWTGAKGQRIATAALAAGGIDSFVDKNPAKHGKRHVAESAIGGLVASRLANGSRAPGHDGSQSPSHSRSRSRSIFGRSQSRGRPASCGHEGRGDSTLKNVAGAGTVVIAGKALYDRMRSKSRGVKGRDRSRSVSSQDSYVPSHSRRNHGYSNRGRSMDGYSKARGSANQGCRLAITGGTDALTKGKLDNSDSESTTDMEQKRTKLKKKELITAGLATVATIQAARGVYTSMAASDNRRKLLSSGEISPEEARRRKSKNLLQDAVAVGIASLGIKSAFSKWKEMNEQRYSVKEIETRRRKRSNMHKRHEKENA